MYRNIKCSGNQPETNKRHKRSVAKPLNVVKMFIVVNIKNVVEMNQKTNKRVEEIVVKTAIVVKM